MFGLIPPRDEAQKAPGWSWFGLAERAEKANKEMTTRIKVCNTDI